MAPIGFLVTWQMISCLALSICSMRGCPRLLDDVLGVVLHVAAVQHRVLRRADVDERGLHAGQHVLHLAEVDVAVDLADVVGRAADVVLDQGAALEHGHLRERRAHLHAHEVAADRAAVALAALAAVENVGVELLRKCCCGDGDAGRALALATAAALLLGGIAGGSGGGTTLAGLTRLPRLGVLARSGRGCRGCRCRTGVADLWLAHECPVGGGWGRSALGDPLRHLRFDGGNVTLVGSGVATGVVVVSDVVIVGDRPFGTNGAGLLAVLATA